MNATDPGERETLTIDDRVVQRVAGYAVSTVTGAAASPRRVLGVNLGGADPEGDADVEARVDGDTVSLEATIAVAWPMSITDVVAGVRASINREVQSTTGLRVDHVDVDVVSLSTGTSSTREPARVR